MGAGNRPVVFCPGQPGGKPNFTSVAPACEEEHEPVKRQAKIVGSRVKAFRVRAQFLRSNPGLFPGSANEHSGVQSVQFMLISDYFENDNETISCQVFDRTRRWHPWAVTVVCRNKIGR